MFQIRYNNGAINFTVQYRFQAGDKTIALGNFTVDPIASGGLYTVLSKTGEGQTQWIATVYDEEHGIISRFVVCYQYHTKSKHHMCSANIGTRYLL